MKFFGPQGDMVLEGNLYFLRNYNVIPHHELRALLLTQKFTLWQMAGIQYNMDIYDPNMEFNKN